METPILKRAVIYCRVSTKEQVEEGNSLVTQEKACKEYALKNGYEVIETFIEQGESAKTQDRKELQRLLRFSEDRTNMVTAVITYKLDRVSRNTFDYIAIQMKLQAYGVEIFSTSEFFDNSPAGRFLKHIIVNVGEFDNDVRAERCSNGMKEATREGRYVWRAPIGYSNVKVGGKGTIAKDDMAPLVLRAFEMVNDTMPLEEIRQKLTESGLVGKNGKPVSKTQFYAMFNNRLYTGWIHKFGEKHKGLFDPIVSEEHFDRVQWILHRKRKRAFAFQKENPDFPLRRFIVHPSGEKITGAWSKGRNNRYAYYRFCKSKVQFRKKDLENSFLELTKKLEFDERNYRSLKLNVEKHLAKGLQQKSKELSRLKAYRNELKERRTSIINKNIQGYISNTIMQEELDRIELEIQNTSSAILGLSDIQKDYDGMLELVEEYLKNPCNVWKMAPFNEKRKLQWFKFPRGIIVDDGKLRTAEVANIFKVKNDVLTPDSRWVDYPVESTNQIPKDLYAVKKPLAEFGKSEKEDTQVYWNKVGEDLVKLSTIIKDIQNISAPKIDS